jgi:hypothetical protein
MALEIYKKYFWHMGFEAFFIDSQMFGSSKTNNKEFRIELSLNDKSSLLALHRNLHSLAASIH